MSGAADEITVRRNREAFDALELKPRVLRRLTGGNTRLELLGRSLKHPLIVAPMAFQKLVCAEGEEATALAASAQEALMVLSCQASIPMEKAFAAGPACRWFQLYFQPCREDTITLVRRAQACGYEAIVLTCDAPVIGIRNQEQRAGFQLPAHVRPVNLQGFAVPDLPPLQEDESAVFDRLGSFAPTWDDISWLREHTDLPILLKGILRADDAEMAIKSGASGIIVSNHGGRTLDTAVPSITALPAIAEQVAGRVPVLLDGGIRRGSDVLKAIALGAAAVLVGRPILYGLAVAGARGVSHVLRILRDELEITMALNGCRTLPDITLDLIAD